MHDLPPRRFISTPPSFGATHSSRITVQFTRRYPAVETETLFDVRRVDPVAEGYDMDIRSAASDEKAIPIDHRIGSSTHML